MERGENVDTYSPSNWIVCRDVLMSVYDTGLDTLTSELGQVIALLDNPKGDSSDLLENQVRSSSRAFCEFSFTTPKDYQGVVMRGDAS